MGRINVTWILNNNFNNMNMRFWSYSRYRNMWSFFFINFVLIHHRLNLAWRSRCRHYLNLEPRWSGCVVCYLLQFYSCLLMIMICRVFNELTEAEDFLSCKPDKWRPTMEGLQRVWTAWKAMLPKFENLHCSPTLHCSLKSWPKQELIVYFIKFESAKPSFFTP